MTNAETFLFLLSICAYKFEYNFDNFCENRTRNKFSIPRIVAKCIANIFIFIRAFAHIVFICFVT